MNVNGLDSYMTFHCGNLFIEIGLSEKIVSRKYPYLSICMNQCLVKDNVGQGIPRILYITATFSSYGC